MSDKIKLCKWDPIHIGFGEVPNPSNEAVMCTLSKFPETNTMIFKADPLNPNADIDLPILLKDDPEIVPDKTTEAKRGYSSTIIIISKIMIKEFIWTGEISPLLQYWYFLDPCFGDSGAPLWITKSGKDSDRNILVAVHAGGYHTNKYFQPICTSIAGRAHKMTDKVLKWIRKNMQRVDN